MRAYDLYLKGLFCWNEKTLRSTEQAVEFYEQFLSADSDFAPACAGLADSYGVLGIFAAIPPRTAMPKAKEAALQALEIDEELAEAHSSLGFITAIH